MKADNVNPNHRQRRWATAVLAASLIAAGAAVPAARADTVLWVGGTGGSLAKLFPPDFFGGPGEILGGAYRDDTFKSVDYPSALWPLTGLLDPTLGQSVAAGVGAVKAAVQTTSGPVIVAGVSQGALVVQQAQTELNDDPLIPSDTTFVLIADPNRGVLSGSYGQRLPIIDYVPRPVTETRFNTVIVTHEYDGFAHPITQPWNLLTDLNAVMGAVYVHTTAHLSDLSTVPAANINVGTNSQGGTTTSYFVPTPQLPLTMPLRSVGVPDETVDAIDTALRPVIDAGYRPPSTGTGRPPREPAERAKSSSDKPAHRRATSRDMRDSS